jgi:hypothetical protein
MPAGPLPSTDRDLICKQRAETLFGEPPAIRYKHVRRIGDARTAGGTEER